MRGVSEMTSERFNHTQEVVALRRTLCAGKEETIDLCAHKDKGSRVDVGSRRAGADSKGWLLTALVGN